MEGINWVGLLSQVPIVAAFIWYTLERDKRDSEHRRQRDDEWRLFLKDQQDGWKSFIDAERLATLEVLRGVMNQLDTVAKQLDGLSAVMQKHNGRVESALMIAEKRGEKS